MRTPLALAAALLILPALASAAAFGFPDRPLWLSSTSAHEGEQITVYAAVYNASESEMKGTVSFIADEVVFDTKDVSLPAGGSSLVTSTWNAIKGSHVLSASFASGAEKELAEKITVSITEAPPPPPAEPTIINQSVAKVQDFIADTVTPDSLAGKAASAVFAQTEKAREAGSKFIEPYAHPAPENKPLMNSAVMPSMSDTAISYGKKGLQLAAAAALFAFDTRWLFYVLAVALFYLAIRGMIRWVQRPRF